MKGNCVIFQVSSLLRQETADFALMAFFTCAANLGQHRRRVMVRIFAPAEESSSLRGPFWSPGLYISSRNIA